MIATYQFLLAYIGDVTAILDSKQISQIRKEAGTSIEQTFTSRPTPKIANRHVSSWQELH